MSLTSTDKLLNNKSLEKWSFDIKSNQEQSRRKRFFILQSSSCSRSTSLLWNDSNIPHKKCKKTVQPFLSSCLWEREKKELIGQKRVKTWNTQIVAEKTTHACETYTYLFFCLSFFLVLLLLCHLCNSLSMILKHGRNCLINFCSNYEGFRFTSPIS